jgi:predicted phage baseplate assembly protein
VSLPAPNLDDRRFQELVDDAKRLVQRRCPEWTDHNVSDPGVTMIELFAWMADQVVYRLNRVPERNYVKFLELIGVRLFPPTAARCDVTFWLSAPRPETLRIPAGTEVSTLRTEAEEPVVFATVSELAIVACSLVRVASSIAENAVRSHAGVLESGESFYCFDADPKPDDTLLLGLPEPVPSCAVALRFDCEIEGIGVDPLDPPLVWEAWDGKAWKPCEIERDETGGLNRAGDVVLHVPDTHEASLIGNQRAGWLRCRVLESRPGQPAYSASPRVNRISAFTIGGTVGAVNAEIVKEELLGQSEGVPGQRFELKRRPVVPNESSPRLLEVSTGEGWEEWQEVPGFAASEAEHRHFVLDAAAGEILLGPAVQEADGTLRQYGAVPPKGATLRLAAYRAGGGRRGNVARRSLTLLRSSIPYVSSVENRRPARGGVDGEDIENAKLRGPLVLSTGDRAVTREDYEQLALEAAPEIARVRCVAAGDSADEGGVRVLVVPAASDEDGRIRFDQLVPPEQVLARIAAHIDERRVIGARVVVEPPVYQGVTIVGRLRSQSGADARRIERVALECLYTYFSPLSGGPGGAGWEFGRAITAGEVYSVLQAVPGVGLVDEVRVYAADPTTGERGKALERIALAPHTLVFSYEHRVRVEVP